MKRIDKFLELAARLAESRAEVQRLEAELDGMLGKPGKAAAVDEPARPEVNGDGEVKRGQRIPQVVALANEGLRPKEIAKRLGTSYATVATAMCVARKRGLLPKARASS